MVSIYLRMVEASILVSKKKLKEDEIENIIKLIILNSVLFNIFLKI